MTRVNGNAVCDGCGQERQCEQVPGREGGEACWLELCDDCLNENPREKGDDDGVEYGDPRDHLAGID